MKKRPDRRTPEERAARRAAGELLETRIRAVTDELEATGSAYLAADAGEELDLAVRLIDAELAASGE